MTNDVVSESEIARIVKEHKILREAIETAPTPFAVYDDEDYLVAWNRAYENIHPNVFKDLNPTTHNRIKYEDVVRISASQSFEDDELENHIKERVKLHRSKEITTDIREYDSGGWHQVTKYITKSNAVCGFAMDINELRRRENELEIAMNAAEAAERAKSEFLANMSHEIRTPMNGVMGMAELLSGTELDSKQAMFTDVIIKSGSSLLTIINDILDFSKIDAGQLELDPAVFDLAEAIEDIATLVSAKVAEKDLELIVRVDPNLPKMMVGDVGRIRQIVTNLVGNAVKFTEKGHVYINLESDLINDEYGDYANIKLSVEDTGIGIPKAQCDRVFQKFSQVDTSATRKHEGTGLGLSIASSLVDLMGGEIGVESEVGMGATFWFTLKLPVHGEIAQDNVMIGDFSGANILIIDDNDVNCSILTEQTTSWNFDNAASNSGEEGLMVMRAAAENNVKVDLVILDYQMPDMSGADVLAEMRADPKLKDIPVIILTSVDIGSTMQQFRKLGAQANLTKPTRSSLLLETILQVLATSSNYIPNVSLNNAPSNEAKIERSNSKNESIKDNQPITQFDILVAEDNLVNQIVFKQILEASGLTFKIVENGEMALEHYKANCPKLILMDVSMPVMNGKDATKAIRAYEVEAGLQRTNIIGVTAHALTGDKQACLEAGMDDYLPKPISPFKLMKKIKSCFDSEISKTSSA